MKGFILKDLYNIAHNAKMMLIVLVILAFAFIPSSGVIGYLCAAIITCCMMVVTTFSFDDMSKWDRFALTLPTKRENIVQGKYIILCIFTLVGLLSGVLISSLATFFFTNLKLTDFEIGVSVGVSIAIISGSITLPLLFRYGAEKARMFMIACFVFPALLILLLEEWNLLGNILMFIEANTLLSIVFALVIFTCILYVTYKISCCIYQAKEIH